MMTLMTIESNAIILTVV